MVQSGRGEPLKTGRDRRRHERVSIRGSLAYRVVRLPSPARMISLLDHMRPGRLKNISRGGIRIESTHLLLPGTLLELRTPPSAFGPARTMRAVVVWVREPAAGRYEMGVRFQRTLPVGRRRT